MLQRFLAGGLLLALLSSGCKHGESDRAFYYWKTTFTIPPGMEDRLEQMNVRKLYIRFFDISWDEATQKALPVGRISFKTKIPKDFTVTPVVYITNKTFLNVEFTKLPLLADNLLLLVNRDALDNSINYSELQTDCDWTELTRQKYFEFLRLLKTRLTRQHSSLSVTIRLHQVKYPIFTGVPPADRGMLMFYNMGKLSAEGSNSIYNPVVADKYVKYVSVYPLPLDAALPCFSWVVHSRSSKITELLNNITTDDLLDSSNFTTLKNGMFSATHSFFLHGSYFMKDDKVRAERVDPQLCLEAARQLSPELMPNKRSVAIFHLDSTLIQKTENNDFETIYRSFR